jgi:hypothetical protein
MEMTMTYGEKAVGVGFNPSGDALVDAIKAGFAALIDQMHQLRREAGPVSPEQARLASVAITEMQTAQMWAVKAATWTDADWEMVK